MQRFICLKKTLAGLVGTETLLIAVLAEGELLGEAVEVDVAIDEGPVVVVPPVRKKKRVVAAVGAVDGDAGEPGRGLACGRQRGGIANDEHWRCRAGAQGWRLCCPPRVGSGAGALLHLVTLLVTRRE